MNMFLIGAGFGVLAGIGAYLLVDKWVDPILCRWLYGKADHE